MGRFLFIIVIALCFSAPGAVVTLRDCDPAYQSYLSPIFERIAHPSSSQTRMSRANWVEIDGERKIFKSGPFLTEQHKNNELAAYAVAQKLGIRRVAKAVKARVNGEDGILIEPVPGVDIEKLPPNTYKAPGLKKALAEANFFDYLIANGDRTTDRDANNLLIVLDDAGTPVDANLIDHHIAFRDAMKPNVPRTKPAALVERLREVPESEWRTLLEGLIPEAEVDSFLERRNRLIR